MPASNMRPQATHLLPRAPAVDLLRRHLADTRVNLPHSQAYDSPSSQHNAAASQLQALYSPQLKPHQQHSSKEVHC
jgi:hypothetical protein